HHDVALGRCLYYYYEQLRKVSDVRRFSLVQFVQLGASLRTDRTGLRDSVHGLKRANRRFGTRTEDARRRTLVSGNARRRVHPLDRECDLQRNRVESPFGTARKVTAPFVWQKARAERAARIGLRAEEVHETEIRLQRKI